MYIYKTQFSIFVRFANNETGVTFKQLNFSIFRSQNVLVKLKLKASEMKPRPSY